MSYTPLFDHHVWISIMGFVILIISTWLACAILISLLAYQKKTGIVYLAMVIVGAIFSLVKLFAVLPALGITAIIVYIAFGVYTYTYIRKKK